MKSSHKHNANDSGQAKEKLNTQIRIARRMREIWWDKMPAGYRRTLKLEIDLNNVAQLNWAFEHAFGSDMDSWSQHVDQLAEDLNKAKREASTGASSGMISDSAQSDDGSTGGTTARVVLPAAAEISDAIPTQTPALKTKWKSVCSHGGLLVTRVEILDDDDTDNQ